MTMKQPGPVLVWHRFRELQGHLVDLLRLPGHFPGGLCGRVLELVAIVA